MPPDNSDYFAFLQDEIARARAQRSLALATLILDAAERLARRVAKLAADATRAHA